MTPHRLSRPEARRIAVHAQLLDAPRPTDVLDVVRHLALLQLDPTAAVTPSADLVLWSRLGPSYDPAELATAQEEGRLIDLLGMLRPAEDVALFRAEMEEWPGTGPLRPWEEELCDWVRANDSCRLDILEQLRQEGPLPASEIPDGTVVRWSSTGWTDNKNVLQLLKLMLRRGEVAIVGQQGREKLWELAERVYPDDPPVPAQDARRIRDARRLAALGLARGRGGEMPVEPNNVGDAGEPATVDGVRGQWRVDPSLLEASFTGRAVLLSPIDRLVYDRKRMAELFESDYQLEMYKPASKRRWGYWAMPILYDDRLVGKLDATSERREGALRVDAVHEDEPFTPAMTDAVDAEIADLARWLGLELERT